MFLSLGSSIDSDRVFNSPQNVWVFLFPQFMVTCISLRGLSGERQRESLLYMFVVMLQGLSSWESRLSFRWRLSGLQNVSGP